MITYVASPYTLHPRGRQVAFEEVSNLTARLIAKTGRVHYSPIVHCHPLALHGDLDPLNVKLWLPFCEVMLSKCDSLLVARLDSWDISSGIAYEVDRALQWKMPIFDVDPVTLAVTKRLGRAAA